MPSARTRRVPARSERRRRVTEYTAEIDSAGSVGGRSLLMTGPSSGPFSDSQGPFASNKERPRAHDLDFGALLAHGRRRNVDSSRSTIFEIWVFAAFSCVWTPIHSLEARLSIFPASALRPWGPRPISSPRTAADRSAFGRGAGSASSLTAGRRPFIVHDDGPPQAPRADPPTGTEPGRRESRFRS